MSPRIAAIPRPPNAGSSAARRPADHVPVAPLLLALAGALVGTLPVTAQEEGRPRACTLRLQPTDSTRAQRIETGPGTYITHVWGGLVWTCGDARMEADSAVKYDAEARLEMIGSVDYRDSIRTLTSRRLDYFQLADRIVATGNVFLTRLESESTLEGPRVEFFRAMGPGPKRTVATGRPHMVFHTDTVPPRDGPPVEVDADEAEFLGEREVRAWGSVEITRPDLRATADSAVFRRDEGTGELFGSPEVESEGFTLAGDRVRTAFVQGEIDRVEAVGEARASGEGFELYAPRIVARLAGEQVEEMWAFGEGRVAALSEAYRLGGDSIRFAFAGGAIDSLQSVGTGTAVQVGDPPPEDPRAEPVLDVEGTRSWVAGDTVVLDFEEAAGPPSAPGDSSVEATEADTIAASDSAGQAPAEEGAAPDTVAARDTVPAARDTASRARLRTMRAAGNARAYYVLRRDSAEAVDPRGAARDYMLGREIVVHFRGGNVDRVEGRQAIGIHLDPEQGAAGARAVPSDTAGRAAPPADTSPPEDAGAPRDTGAAPADTAVDPDTAAAADTTAASDTASAPPDTTGGSTADAPQRRRGRTRDA